jgi:hypothetical protein
MLYKIIVKYESRLINVEETAMVDGEFHLNIKVSRAINTWFDKLMPFVDISKFDSAVWFAFENNNYGIDDTLQISDIDICIDSKNKLKYNLIKNHLQFCSEMYAQPVTFSIMIEKL